MTLSQSIQFCYSLVIACMSTIISIIFPRDLLEPIQAHLANLRPHLCIIPVMSQPPSSAFTSSLSSFEVQNDRPQQQQRSAVSDSARHERLAALERRLNRSATTESSPNSPLSSGLDATTPLDPQPFDANHAKRTEFRRLADPGIMRPNSKEVALRSLHVNLISFFAPCHSRAN